MSVPANAIPEPWKTDLALLDVHLKPEELELEVKMRNWQFVPEADQDQARDDGDDGDGGDDTEEDGDEVEERPLQNMKREMAKYKGSVNSNEEYQEFAMDYYREMRAHVQRKASTPLLDLSSSLLTISNWKLWAKLLLDVAKSLGKNILLDQNRHTKNTCLHEALLEGHDDDQLYLHFIRFLGIFSEASDFGAAIAATNSRKETCLHTAIAQVDDVDLEKLHLVRYLTEKARPDTLICKRGRTEKDDLGPGNTCLHDLMDIRLSKGFGRECPNPPESCKRCIKAKGSAAVWENYCAQYLLLLERMTAKQPEAVKLRNEAHQSPFLFHASTKARIQGKNAWIISQPQDNGIQTKTGETSKTQSPIAPNKNRGKSWLGKKGIPEEKDKPAAPDKTASPVALLPHKNNVVRYSEQLSNKASDKLREHCLSQDNFVDVCESLFGKDYPRAELTFKAAPLNDKTTNIHSGLPLDQILADVELNLVDTSLPSSQSQGQLDSQTIYRTSDQIRKARAKLRREREDREDLVKDFFQWLQKKRGVKKIIKLAVYDHKQMPCRDEVIRECLKGFDIRYLDWDKEDLSISYLAKEVTPHLKELWLSWSGRHTALLGWSNKEHGLRTLKELKTVHIATTTEWETLETYRNNITDFKRSLQGSITVEDSIETDSSFETTGHDDLNWRDDRKRSLWLDAITEFRNAVDTKISAEIRNKGHVAVAVVDTGVNLSELDSAKNVYGAWYADRKMPDRRAMNTWYFAQNKHGTEMVRLVQLVCPYAEIYMAKLDVDKLVYKSIAHSAAEAIRGAISKKVNVISMSYTMYKEKDKDNKENSDRQDGISEMMRAIDDAAKNPLNAIMFCACEDEGNISQKQPYPATDRDKRILKCIGSAGIYGERAEYVDEKSIDYLFPGELAVDEDKIKDKICTGSSVATALAAGLAALVLWCASLQTSSATNIRAGAEAVPAANEGRLVRRATGLVEDTNFQDPATMYKLFDKLMDPKGNQLVNVTGILKKAAKDVNPPKKLIELAKQAIGRLA